MMQFLYKPKQRFAFTTQSLSRICTSQKRGLNPYQEYVQDKTGVCFKQPNSYQEYVHQPWHNLLHVEDCLVFFSCRMKASIATEEAPYE
jgi:hypothetical protein